ncbi:MAG: putative bifunctional diguanylate cyclase/phosphodiesterase [Solirubrobacteraceae bacterium]
MSDRRTAGEGDAPPARGANSPSSDYVGLLRAVPAILYTAEAGENGRWAYVSPQIELILGFAPAQWCDDPGLWASRLHPDDRERALGVESAALNDLELNASGELEYRLRHRDGHYVWVRDDALLNRDADGVHRWHGVLSDVTAQKRTEAELERRLAQQAAVARRGEHALEGGSPAPLMRAAVDALVNLLDMDIAAVAEHVAEDDAFVFHVTHGMPGAEAERVPGGLRCLSGYVMLTGRATIVADWETERRFERSGVLSRNGARCGLTVSIEGRHGRFGALGCHSRTHREITQGDVDFVQALANILGDVVEREQTADDIRHQALHDPLTGAPNRILFLDRLQQATERLRRRRDSLTAVLILDLDRFKLVNDSLGHVAGDELLAAIAPRLRQAVRSSDTVARFGADEFAVLLEDIGSEQDAVEMAQRIAGVFTRPFVVGGDEHFVTTSIGISLARGGEPAEDLIRDAAAAMHRAKERGGARYELFDEGLRGRAMYRLRVENSLRRALEREEFVLEYQPVISLADGRLIGAEALIRWDDPERGRIAPNDFVPVAEENGLIEPIGRWVLDQACRQAAQWQRQRPDQPPVQVSVNLSAAQLANVALIDSVRSALRGSGLDPGALVLELTESVLAGEATDLAATLEALQAIGVRLALDDFGTGYSSLSYLTRLPLHVLKVDRSFVDGLGVRPRDSAVTEAIVAMSRALSLRVVGEGAETAEQVRELVRLGCDFAQGFYFSRPVPASELTRMLADGHLWLMQLSAQRARAA